MRSVAFVFGTRPEAIKMAPVIDAAAASGRIRTKVIVTAQHRELLDSAMAALDLHADIDLDLMRPNQSLESLTAAAVPAIAAAIANLQPDMVLVQGDTTTAFAAALAAFYQKRPVGHVEAGLRSGDPMSPFPEEINRILIDHIASLHFAPTPGAKARLLAEGISPGSVTVTGNTGIDQLLRTASQTNLERMVNPPDLLDLPRPFILATAHRRENHGPRLHSICQALLHIARDFPAMPIVFPAHPNPNIQAAVSAELRTNGAVRILPPVDYPTMVWLMREARLILTDSGGIQEEAPYLAKPVLVMRDTTERPEGVAAGVARLVGTATDDIVAAASEVLRSTSLVAPAAQPYGDGRASHRIIDLITDYLDDRRSINLAGLHAAWPIAESPRQAPI